MYVSVNSLGLHLDEMEHVGIVGFLGVSIANWTGTFLSLVLNVMIHPLLLMGNVNVMMGNISLGLLMLGDSALIAMCL